MTASEDASGDPQTVPAPVPPDSPDAWYAPDVRAQREVHPGVVAHRSSPPYGRGPSLDARPSAGVTTTESPVRHRSRHVVTSRSISLIAAQ